MCTAFRVNIHFIFDLLAPLIFSLLLTQINPVPRAWFCWTFLLVKREFFLATVAKCLVILSALAAVVT